MLLKLEHGLSPMVAFGIMPLLLLQMQEFLLKDLLATLLNPVPLGIVLGLFWKTNWCFCPLLFIS